MISSGIKKNLIDLQNGNTILKNAYNLYTFDQGGQEMMLYTDKDKKLTLYDQNFQKIGSGKNVLG